MSVLSILRSALRYRLLGGVQHLIVHVTDRCPLRCRTCFVRPVPGGRDLSPGELAPFVRALGPVRMVDLAGGEPFLRQDLPELCALFPRATIGIPTCGWDAPTVVGRVRDVLAAVPPRRLFVVLSLDGFEKTNDAIRGPGTFAHALGTLRALKAVPDLQVKVNTVLCRENAAELIDFMRFIRAERPFFHSVLLLRGEPHDPACALPPVEEIERLAPAIISEQTALARAAGPTGRAMANYVSLLWEVSLCTLRERRQVVSCLAGGAHLVVCANGDVAPCELLPPVGNLRTNTPEAILNGRALAQARGTIARGACHCTHNCNLVENILFDPRLYPALAGLRRLSPGPWHTAVTAWGRRPSRSRVAGPGAGVPPRPRAARRAPSFFLTPFHPVAAITPIATPSPADALRNAPLAVTVVIPSRDRPALLEQCLKSLAGQTYRRLEVVVVDDGSADAGAYRAVAARHGVRLLRHETSRGQAAARNRAVRQSAGDLLIFLDDDCAVGDPHWAARHVAVHLAHPGAMVDGGVETVTATLAGRTWAAFNPSGPRPEGHLETMNLSVRRETLAAVGFFREDLRELEDMELSARAQSAGVPLLYAHDLRVRHHFRPTAWQIARRVFQYGVWAVPVRRAVGRAPWYLPRGRLSALLLFLPLTVGHAALRIGQGLRRAPARPGRRPAAGPPDGHVSEAAIALAFLPFLLVYCASQSAGIVWYYWRRRRVERCEARRGED